MNVSDPTRLTPISTYTSPGFCAQSVAFDGHLAIIGGGIGIGCASGYEILDLSSPTAPIRLARVNVAGGSRAQLVGRTAYVIDKQGLQIIDLTDPANPREAGRYTGLGFTPNGIQVAGDHAYLFGENTRPANRQEFGSSAPLQIVNIAELNQPRLAGGFESLHTAAFGANLATSDGPYVYVTESVSGAIRILDSRNPAAPRVVATIRPGGEGPLAVSNGYLFAGTRNGFQVTDVHDPAHPIPMADYDFSFVTAQIVSAGHYLYLLGRPASSSLDTSQVRILDVSNPLDAPGLATYPVTDKAYQMQVENGFLYLATPPVAPNGPGGLRILDVRDSAAPVEIAYLELPGHVRGLQVSDGIAYLNEDASRHTGTQTTPGLRLVNVNDPFLPVSIAFFPSQPSQRRWR